jgi:hypothetical protein
LTQTNKNRIVSFIFLYIPKNHMGHLQKKLTFIIENSFIPIKFQKNIISKAFLKNIMTYRLF